MPRGENPNSRKNLKQFNTLSMKERKELSRAGGRASGESKRFYKSFREINEETTTEAEKRKMLEKLKKKAIAGDLRAFEIYRDTIGEKPSNEIQTVCVPVFIQGEENLLE